MKKKGVTVLGYSLDSTSFQIITSQSKGVIPLKIYQEEPKSSTAVIQEFENDEVDHITGGRAYICDNHHDRAHFSLANHHEMNGMRTSTELNIGSVQLEREVDLKADMLAEVMDTQETDSVNDQRVAHLSTDVKAELELIIKDSGFSAPALRQRSKRRNAIASDPPLSSSTCVTQSSLVLSS
ncbi:unnamed protein product, partial [Trichobilharzia regenti]